MPTLLIIQPLMQKQKKEKLFSSQQKLDRDLGVGKKKFHALKLPGTGALKYTLPARQGNPVVNQWNRGRQERGVNY